MSKTVTSTIARFKGSVTIADPLTFAQVARWEEALAYYAASKDKPQSERWAEAEQRFYPLIIEFVEKWELENIQTPVTVENFPNATAGTSARSIHLLIAWLINECQSVYNGNEDADPNA